MALILVLLFVTLISVLVVEFSYESQVEASFAINQGSDLEAYLAAKSAVAKGIAALAQDQSDAEYNGEPMYDSALDAWAMGVPFSPLNGAMMRTAISDEYGKINLNALLDTSEGKAPVERETLVNALIEFFLLRTAESDDSAEAIVDAILDWLDYEDGDDEHPEGAENDYYNGLENPFACKNGPMDSLEELLLIKGMSPELYYGDAEKEQLPLTEYLTVNGDWLGRVNINTARPEVIAAMMAGFSGGGADPGRAEQIYDEARINPFRDASQVDTFWKPPDSRKEKEKEKEDALNAGEAARARAAGPFVVSSSVFRIYGDGMVEDVLVRIEAYVWRTPLDLRDFNTMSQQLPQQQEMAVPVEPFRVLSWNVIR